jgi:hypothetical protein
VSRGTVPGGGANYRWGRPVSGHGESAGARGPAREESGVAEPRSKGGPNWLQKFQRKYGQKELEVRNNFPHRNLSIIEMELE